MFSSTQSEANLSFSQSSDSPAKVSNNLLLTVDWRLLLSYSLPRIPQNRDAPGTIPVTVKNIIEASQSADDKSNFLLLPGVDISNVNSI